MKEIVGKRNTIPTLKEFLGEIGVNKIYFYKHFKSKKDFLKQAGITLPNQEKIRKSNNDIIKNIKEKFKKSPAQKKNATKKALISMLKRTVKRLNYIPSLNEFHRIHNLHRGYCKNFFKSKEIFFRAAGIELPKNLQNKKLTKEEVIQKVKEKSKELRRSPYSYELQNICYQGIKFFGSWNETLRLAGLKINKRKKLSSEEKKEYKKNYEKLHRGRAKDYSNTEKREVFIDKFLKLKNELNRNPILAELLNLPPRLPENQFYKYFKDIDDLYSELSKHGIKRKRYIPPAPQITSKKEVIKRIQEAYSKLGEIPTTRQIGTGYETIKKYFGNYSNALKEAGLKQN